MLLPTKHVLADRALLGVASRVLKHLRTPATVSEVWNRFNDEQPKSSRRVDFGWFVLALCSLYALDRVSFDGAVLRRESPK
jgi:hypothetical protein